MSYPCLSSSIRLRHDLKTPGLANIAATTLNLLGFEAPPRYDVARDRLRPRRALRCRREMRTALVVGIIATACATPPSSRVEVNAYGDGCFERAPGEVFVEMAWASLRMKKRELTFEVAKCVRSAPPAYRGSVHAHVDDNGAVERIGGIGPAVTDPAVTDPAVTDPAAGG